jgi:hypothetical protein
LEGISIVDKEHTSKLAILMRMKGKHEDTDKSPINFSSRIRGLPKGPKSVQDSSTLIWTSSSSGYS